MINTFTECSFTKRALEHLYLKLLNDDNKSKTILVIDCDYLLISNPFKEFICYDISPESIYVMLFSKADKVLSTGIHSIAAVKAGDSLEQWCAAMQDILSGKSNFSSTQEQILRASPYLHRNGKLAITLKMVSEGLSINEIARKQRISEKTVYGYTKRLMQIFGLPNIPFLYVHSKSILLKADGYI